jgi:hypothetical protein
MYTETDLAQEIVTALDFDDLSVTILDPKELPIPTTRVRFRTRNGEEFVAVIVRVEPSATAVEL